MAPAWAIFGSEQWMRGQEIETVTVSRAPWGFFPAARGLHPGCSVQLTFCSLLRGALGVQAPDETHALPGPLTLPLSSPDISPKLWNHPSILQMLASLRSQRGADFLPQWYLYLCSLSLGGPAALDDSKLCSVAHIPSPRALPLPLMSLGNSLLNTSPG